MAVYKEPFRLVQDVTIPMRGDIDAEQLASEPGATLRVDGVLAYQACDHETCYLPAEAPLSWELDAQLAESKSGPLLRPVGFSQSASLLGR